MNINMVPVSWETLQNFVQTCHRCKLCQSRQNVVYGEGTGSSGLVFVGEGPGAKEDETGRPFVGRAGELLTASLRDVLGLSRAETYICNIVKCRPPKNRQPEEDEIAQCLNYLNRQLELLNPKVIVTLGNVPKKALTGNETGITRIRGRWLSWRGIPVMPTFHPAYLLRNNSQTHLFHQDLFTVALVLQGLARVENV